MIQMYQTTVAAAVIRRDGRILVCRRRADQAHPRKWEFPGGKLESGESSAAALARELREELGIEARVGAELERYEYCYQGGRPLMLIFHAVDAFAGELQNRIFEELRWEEAGRLGELDFLEGDRRFLRKLSAKPPYLGPAI